MTAAKGYDSRFEPYYRVRMLTLANGIPVREHSEDDHTVLFLCTRQHLGHCFDSL